MWGAEPLTQQLMAPICVPPQQWQHGVRARGCLSFCPFNLSLCSPWLPHSLSFPGSGAETPKSHRHAVPVPLPPYWMQQERHTQGVPCTPQCQEAKVIRGTGAGCHSATVHCHSHAAAVGLHLIGKIIGAIDLPGFVGSWQPCSPARLGGWHCPPRGHPLGTHRSPSAASARWGPCWGAWRVLVGGGHSGTP